MRSGDVRHAAKLGLPLLVAVSRYGTSARYRAGPGSRGTRFTRITIRSLKNVVTKKCFDCNLISDSHKNKI